MPKWNTVYQHPHPKSLKSSSPNEGHRDRCAQLPSAMCQPVLWNSECSCQALGISREKRSSFQRARALTIPQTPARGTQRPRSRHGRGRQDTRLIPVIHRHPNAASRHGRNRARGRECWQRRPAGEGGPSPFWPVLCGMASLVCECQPCTSECFVLRVCAMHIL